MGYTHYWRQHRDFTKVEWTALTEYTRKIVDAAKTRGIELADGMGTIGTDPEIDADTIYLNGRDPDEYETFNLKRKKEYKDYIPREEQDREGCFAFCKTQYCPYDPVVVTILVAANQIAPDAIEISSDGGPEALVFQFLDLVPPPG